MTMAFSSVAGGKHGRLFSLRLLLLAASHCFIPIAINGQQAGVSLKLQGVTIPSDSLVDWDELLYTTNDGQNPTNANGHDQTLVCETDLVDCCDAPRTVRGNWYFPNGDIVTDTGSRIFRSNRGPNEERNGRQFNGSVRIFRRYTPLTPRGRFRCELPNAADVNQILYANIVNFGPDFRVPPVTISPSGSTGTAGETYSLTCSTTLHPDSVPFPSDVPVSPTFEWFFGNNSSLPSGVTSMGTTFNNVDTYTSTLQFSPLSQSHAGMYICRIGPGSLANNAMVTVNAPAISVQINISGDPMLGQNGYSLTCGVNGAENLNPTITYQWTKSDGPDMQAGTNSILSFSTLRFFDAGQYTCRISVNSLFLNNDIMAMGSEVIRIQIPAPTVTLSSSIPNPIPPFGSDVTLICSVELSPLVDIPVTVNIQLSDPSEDLLTTALPSMSGSTYNITRMIASFGRDQSGVYTCTATVHSTSPNTFVTDSNSMSNSIRVTTGVYLALRGAFIAKDSNVNIRNIGYSNGALQCITDKTSCCETPTVGEWLLPSGASIQQTVSNGMEFYVTRGSSGEVWLNRPSDVMSPTGQFCCRVPDATDTNQILCVNIGGLSIMASGSTVAGENYTLECSAGGSEGTLQWLGPPDGRTPVVSSGSVTINSASTTSQLQFRPLQQSHNGSYLCSASSGGQTLSSEPIDISVNAPSVSVQITDGGAAPTTGEIYHLTCSVSGADNLNPTMTYQWTKNSGGQTQVGTNSNTLYFTPLRLFDAIDYACSVTISSSYLSVVITAMSVNSHIVRIQMPTPSSITLTSSEGNFIVIGSDITLTCTVRLHSAMVESDLPLLMVDVQLSRDGTPLTLTNPTVTGTTFTYTTQVNSFGRSDSGNYICTATVRPQPSSTFITGSETLQSGIISIRAASAPPVNIQATQSSSSALVEVSWSPPSDGATNITGYRIFYGNEQTVFVASVAVITLVGLKVDGNYVGQNVSIRSESGQLYSELINVSVTAGNNEEQGTGAIDTTMLSSCSSQIGITVGVIVVVVCLVVMVITVTVLLCLWRKKSLNKDDFAVSANMAYGEVNLKPGEMEGEYENPDKILGKSSQGTESTTTATYETVYTSNPAAPEYASTDKAVCVTNKQ